MTLDFDKDLDECKMELAGWLTICDTLANELKHTILTGVDREKIIVKLIESAILVGGWSQQINVIESQVKVFAEI